jgi:radical SAM superfamily enzyme YgiQ (UPF0313 family)
MKILFIYPNPLNSSNSPSNKILKIFLNDPLSTFEALGNVTPKEHSVDIIDERLEKINFEDDYDLIGISAMTNQAPRAYAIADEFIKRGKKVALGGWHPSAMPEEAMQHANAIVIGEGEELWPQLLIDVERGKLKQIYRQDKPIDFSTIPITRNRKTKRSFIMAMPIEATRGCPQGCNFCAITNNPGYRIFHSKPVDRVIEEIRSISQKYLLFNDASLTIDIEYTKKLFRKMKKLNKKFYCFGNSNVLLKDEELLKLAYEAGCISWSIGFDSVSQESINSIGKRSNLVDEYKSAINKIHDFGMNVEGSFMFGFDSDTLDIFDDTLDFICSSEIDSAAFHILTPFPGTPLFNMLNKQNRILTRDWSKYDCTNVVFKLKNINAEDLKKGIKKIYKDFYSPLNVLKINMRNLTKGFYPLYISMSHSLQVIKKVNF